MSDPVLIDGTWYQDGVPVTDSNGDAVAATETPGAPPAAPAGDPVPTLVDGRWWLNGEEVPAPDATTETTQEPATGDSGTQEPASGDASGVKVPEAQTVTCPNCGAEVAYPS